MNSTSRLMQIAVAALMFALCACGGGGYEDSGPGTSPIPQPPGTMIGAAGGTVTGPNGAKVEIPAGALASNTLINIEQSSVGSPALPATLSTVGAMFAFTPHGTTFALPVTITLPFDTAMVPASKVPTLFKTDSQNQWVQLTSATFGGNTVGAEVTSFSWVQVGGLLRDDPVRTWEFNVFPGNGQDAVSLPGGTALVGELVEVFAEFGPQPLDSPIQGIQETLLPDGVANGYVMSTPTGVTYLIVAESPDGLLGTDEPIGSSTQFRQTQSYIKLTSNATLTFTVTTVFVGAEDFNSTPEDESLLLNSTVGLTVRAYKNQTPKDYFYHATGFAWLYGSGDIWIPNAEGDAIVEDALWTMENFNFSTYAITSSPTEANQTCRGKAAALELKQAIPYRVDLSSLDVGDEFTLDIDTYAEGYSRRGGGFAGDCQMSRAVAAIRDPLEIGGGPTLAYSGLEPTNRPVFAPLTPQLVSPAACVPGPGPNAASGVIQFSASSFILDEWAGATPSVTVTRTGGSVGAVTATFATSNGTAVAGTDYVAVNATVFFADGESGQRIVAVNAIPDPLAEADKTVNLTLSQPGGCGALGAQTSAVLTIKDDRLVVPPPPSFTVGGTVTGLVGTGLSLQDQHFTSVAPTSNGPFTFRLPTPNGATYSATILTQPNNPIQVCTIANGSGTIANANVTNIAVNCTTPPPNGALDPTFGSAGKVSTTFGGDETAMAIQADGKIVMVGGSPADFVLARYNVNGTLDTSFGSGGFVTTDVASGLDVAHGVAIQSDDKIVVVGTARVGTNNNFGIVRFDANGNPDGSFGTLGRVTTDFNGVFDEAYGVVIQSDNKIVVVGSAALPSLGGTNFAVARYEANGALDVGFGASGTGKVTLDIAGGVDIAHRVVLQNGGTILVSGLISIGSSSLIGHAGLARFTAAGALDTSFGTGGKLTLANLALGEGLALQDGKILIAGNAPVGGSIRFALMRLTANGATDGSFGSSGLVTTSFSTQDDYAHAVAVQADGRIVVVGQSSNRSNPDFAIARYNEDGQPDLSFDLDGKLTIDFFSSFDGAENVAVQADGMIVVGGHANNGTRSGYALVRVQP